MRLTKAIYAACDFILPSCKDAGANGGWRIDTRIRRSTFGINEGQLRGMFMQSGEAQGQARRDIAPKIFARSGDKVVGDASAGIDNQERVRRKQVGRANSRSPAIRAQRFGRMIPILQRCRR